MSISSPSKSEYETCHNVVSSSWTTSFTVPWYHFWSNLLRTRAPRKKEGGTGNNLSIFLLMTVECNFRMFFFVMRNDLVARPFCPFTWLCPLLLRVVSVRCTKAAHHTGVGAYRYHDVIRAAPLVSQLFQSRRRYIPYWLPGWSFLWMDNTELVFDLFHHASHLTSPCVRCCLWARGSAALVTSCEARRLVRLLLCVVASGGIGIAETGKKISSAGL